MLRFALPIARYTVVEAARNRLVWLLVVALLAAVMLAGFLQQVSLTEANRVEGVVIAAFMRVVGVFLVAAIVVTGVVREFNDKVLEVLLAKPMPRASYLLGKLAGFAAVALVVAVVAGLPLVPFVPFPALAAWCASLFGELVIVVAAALFCVLTLNQVVTALSAVLGFYVLARSMAAVQIIADASGPPAGLKDRVTGTIVDVIAALLPAFDRMTQTAWLVEGLPSLATAGQIAVQCAVYVSLLAGAALFDLYRQNF
jgi:ABC-type transport system involved in multi-copper enzyme maturation permease subunit